MKEDEDEAFPCDRITSDPTFFDDFMPEQSQTLPRPTLVSCLPTQTTSPELTRYRKPVTRCAKLPVGKRSLSNLRGSWLSDEEDESTVIQSEPDLWSSRRTMDDILQKAQPNGTIFWSLGKSDHQDLKVADRKEPASLIQEETNTNTTEGGTPNLSHIEIRPEESVMNDAVARTYAVHFPPVKEQPCTTTVAERIQITNLHKLDDKRKVTLKGDALPSADSVSQQPVYLSGSVSVHSIDATQNTNSASEPKSNPETMNSSNSPPPESLKTPCSQVFTISTPTARRSSKVDLSRMDSLEFETVHLRPDRAYSVKYRQETKLDAGSQWSRATKRMFVYISITKHARVKYTVGDLVSLTFTEGNGGSAKILEIRDTGTPFIVVQWLYSRTDAARLGTKLPPLEKWPKGLYMLSDHFQVICVENLNGKSGSTPIEDVYWQISGKCLRPSDEIQRKLRDQSG